MLHKLDFYTVNLDDENSSFECIHANIHDCVWFSTIILFLSICLWGGYVGVSTGNCRIERHYMPCRKSYRQFAPSRVGAKNQTWIFYKTAM